MFRYTCKYHKLSHNIFPSEAGDEKKRTLIIGAGETGQLLFRSLKQAKNSTYEIVGFLDDNIKIIGIRFQDKKIYGPIDDLPFIAKVLRVKQVIIAMPSASAKRIKHIITLIHDTDITISTVPTYLEIINGTVTVDNIREIQIEDLLKRDRISIDMNKIFSEVSNKDVLVTGAAGSIGSQICKNILAFRPRTLIALDQSETPLFYLERELKHYKGSTRLIPIISDITNTTRIHSVFNKLRPDIVLHAAAYKHVSMMEYNFEESIMNNALGTKQIADCADEYGVKRFVMISTDKAVNPSSVMGLAKRIAEIYIQGLNTRSQTRFITVRFGNVLDSVGNVIEIFKKQLKQGGPLTVTHPEMKRYFMLTSEAVQLVIQAGMFGNGGEIFLLDMGEPIKIVDLAKTMIKISGYEVGKDIDIEFTDIRPGEKLFEELRYDDEMISPTPHEKIFAWKSRSYDLDYINTQISALSKSLYSANNLEITKNIISNLVPEYQNMPTLDSKLIQYAPV